MVVSVLECIALYPLISLHLRTTEVGSVFLDLALRVRPMCEVHEGDLTLPKAQNRTSTTAQRAIKMYVELQRMNPRGPRFFFP
jgi:hypothetical protein